MIRINLLGSAKYLAGSSSLVYERQKASIEEILQFVQRNSESSYENLKLDNIIIAINGVESSALSTSEPTVVQGDIVTIVPIVHGG